MAPSKKVASSVAAVLLVGCLMAAALFRYDQSVEHGKEVSLLTNEELTAKVEALEKQLSQTKAIVNYLRWKQNSLDYVSQVRVTGPVKPTKGNLVKFVEFRGRPRFTLSFYMKVMVPPQLRSTSTVMRVGTYDHPSPEVSFTRDNRLKITQSVLKDYKTEGKTFCEPAQVLAQGSETRVSMYAYRNTVKVFLNGKQVCSKDEGPLPLRGAQPFYLSIPVFNAADVEIKGLSFTIS